MIYSKISDYQPSCQPSDLYRRRILILFTLSPVLDLGWPATLLLTALFGVLALTERVE